MFVAHSSFEHSIMSAVGSKGDRYFRAMELSTRQRWFIVTCALQDDGLEMLHSICCAWDVDLLSLLAPAVGRTTVSVQQLSPSMTDGGWEALDVDQVWQAVDAHGNRVAILQDADGHTLHGVHEIPERRGLEVESLVFQAGHVAGGQL